MTYITHFEIATYKTLCILPYIFFCFYTFRNNLRFNKIISILAAFFIILFQVISEIYSFEYKGSWFAALPHTFILVGLLILFTKAHFGKCLFTVFMFSNISHLIRCAAKCLEGFIFPTYADDPYRWTNCLTLLICEILILIPFFFYYRKMFAKVLFEASEQTIWRYIWFVPVTFYAVWFRNYYFSAEGAITLALRPRHLVYTIVLNIGAQLVYAMVVKFINQEKENTALREREFRYLATQEQYDNLQDKIEEARRARHDLRHHAHMVSAYIKDKKYDELEAYVNKYVENTVSDDTLAYCDHYEINAILKYFSGVSKENNIGFSAQVALPKDIGIPTEDISVVLGNLLENALQACLAEEKPIISIRGTIDDSGVFFKIVNTFTGKVRKNDQGFYLSTKHEGRGIGLRSVRGVVEEHNGMLKIKQEDGLFIVSVLLNK